MKQAEHILGAFSDLLWGDWLLFALLGVGLLYTVLTGAVQIRKFPYTIKKTLLEPVLSRQRDSQEAGTITSFQSLCTAVASCVGSGNIVGVSTAVIAGGMGAIFWMWMAALLGMATKYGEIILGMLYRQKNEEGQYVGGPMYYIEHGLRLRWLAALCAGFMVAQIICGNFIQANTISGVLGENFGVPHLATGIGLALLIFIVTLGGLKRLAHVTQKLVPFMACVYVFSGLVIILLNITKVPQVLSDIVRGAFGLRAAAGGALGSMIAAMQKGVARGLYSNEAGEGSAPVIHSSASVRHPVEQGLAGVTEVFLDTFVICTISGLVIGITGVLGSGSVGSTLVIRAFAAVWPPLRYVVILSLSLFCTTTLMSQWYFGFVGLNYLFSASIAEKFKYIFPFFCVIGAVLTIDLVWTLQDIALGMLTIPNLIAIVILSPQVRRATKDFFKS